MRRLLGALNPREGAAALAPQPGMDGLDALIGRARAAGIPVELHVEGERRPIPPGMDLAAYRILQEALTNVLKHSGLAPTDVHVRWSGDGVELEVVDRGPGPGGNAHDEAFAAGQGLIGMQERVRLYGGELHTGRRRGGGFEVKARIPFQTEEVT
jgi:signal transduction histidine kinase